MSVPKRARRIHLRAARPRAQADAVLAALTDNGGTMTQTEISNLFRRHRDASQLDDLRDRLERWGRVRPASEHTGGRPSRRWVLIPSPISLSSQLAGLADYLGIARKRRRESLGVAGESAPVP